ncbi:MAG: energy transducer TonB [Polyangiaceae bacterium]|nr:energy transducer TonB [Polyangiaceae bacterium]
MKPSDLTMVGARTESGWVHALLVIVSGALHLGMLSASVGSPPIPVVPPGPIEVGIVDLPEPEEVPLPPPVSAPEPEKPRERADVQQQAAPSEPPLEPPPSTDASTLQPDTAADVLSDLSDSPGFAISSTRTTILRASASTRAAPSTNPEPARKKPALVALSALGRKPTPPDLSSALEHNYPIAARQLGLNGKATLRARVDADGLVRAVEPVAASLPDFAEACAKTIKNSLWGAPRDNQGNPVATWIRYTCRFEARR